MWVRLNSTVPVHNHQEFFNFNTWGIGMWWHGTAGGHTNNFRVHQTNGTTGLHSTISLPAHTDWIMLGQVFDGTTIRHIINNNIVTGTVASFSATGAHLPRIGSRFPGLIDEVSIYNRALSAAEITDLFNNYGHTTLNHPDRVLVRRLVSPEPTSSIGGEEPIITQQQLQLSLIHI